tara:strand:+ start:1739 stop:2749 length:1011 start_codon:yes stop_codon:yes gene_type:complete
MKWIGQHIWDQVSKFRNTVEFKDTVDFSEDVTFYQPVNNADPNISIGSSDDERLQIYINYQGADTQLAQLILFKTYTESTTANDGRFRFVVDENAVLEIDDGGIDFFSGLAGGISFNGTDVITDNGSGTTTLSNIDALDATTEATVESAIDTLSNLASIGTITTGVWQGTAIATDYLKHKSTFELSGYAVADGTNYMMADIMSGNKAPFLHDETSIGANGTTADNPAAFLRAAGTVMPYNGTLKIWKGWGASNGTPTVDVAIFKYSPTADDATSDSLVLVKNTQFTGAGNDNLKTWSETSFSVTVTAGDILITAIKGSVNAKTAYFVSTVEIEWTS